MSIISQTQQSIIYIDDPNNVNINTDLTNGISQYQDMHISAELTAIRRGRTVVVIGGGIKTDDTLIVNFIGNNQNENNPNYLNFTTNFYEGSTAANETQYESFGITSIKVVVNSSFVPQVNIQFLDVRGLSFFNNDNSPYRILFDFPPPIFNLKFKGYYGKTLEYSLHLVKYTSEFKAENGNFIINAEFIALTYAPLTDILFRYLINGVMVDKNISELSSKPEDPPVNTYDLILKLKNLYAAVNTKIKNSEETKTLKVLNDDIDYTKTSTQLLANYIENLKEKGTPVMFAVDSSNETIEYTEGFLPTAITNTNSSILPINSLSEYDAIIQTFPYAQAPNTIVKRLYVGYLYNDVTITTQNNMLDGYKNKLIDSAKGIVEAGIVGSDIKSPNVVRGNENVITYGYGSSGVSAVTYTVIDVTNYYVKLYRTSSVIPERKNILTEQLNTLVNDSILGILGMSPTIYNIFKILLDDVDVFFDKLRAVSYDAEKNHHNNPTYKQIIAGQVGKSDVTDTIYAFPLVMKMQRGHCVEQEVRTSPKEISDLLPVQFPELDFIYKFMDTFATQYKLSLDNDMRGQQNPDGTYKWIPITPLDSVLGTTNANSPYRGLDFSTYEKTKALTEILLNRLYILSEFAIPNSYFNSNKKISDAYVKLYAASEATNVMLSVNDTVSSANLKTFADTYANSPEEFYKYLEEEPVLTNYMTVNSEYVTNVGEYIYIDKNDAKYRGVSVYEDVIQNQTIPDDTESPLRRFITSVQNDGWLSIFRTTLPQASYSFTLQNTLLINDAEVEEGKLVADTEVRDSVAIKTRYLGAYTTTFSVKTEYFKGDEIIAKTFIRDGNIVFGGTPSATSDKFTDSIDLWARQLAKFDNVQAQTYLDIIKSDTPLSALLIVSCMGFALSPFNIYPNNIGPNIYQTPAVIETPFFITPYVGALIRAKETGTFEAICKFLTGATGQALSNQGLYIFADYHDVNTYLSPEDTYMYGQQYDKFYFDQNNLYSYKHIKEILVNLMDRVIKLNLNKIDDRYDKYTELFNSGSENYYSRIIQPLMERRNIVVNSEKTFAMEMNDAKYVSLKEQNAINKKNNVNDDPNSLFFKTFFTKLSSELVARNAEIVAKENEQKRLKGDEDILNQMYYSFKNINDKWLSNPTEQQSGYPYNTGGNKLIDSFIFVDRAMNPIGDTILNPEILIELADDPNVSIFSVISQLLSMNNFEFFPLQNFMTGSREGFEDTFKIDPSGNVDKRAAFMCMYIGGSSSYPTNIGGNGFKNDGIEDITTTDATDFKNCNEETETSNVPIVIDNNGKGFEFKQVRAFRVKFGQQNQSMFKDIKIDSKEYPETNESIQILSRLANDQQNNAPTPKGQNLYSMYENRAYSATVTGLGNAMIQPTQYFQLDNVPMYNGAYLILSVEHNIQANSMTTSFTGTKILRYPIPRVTNPATGMGFEGSTGEFTLAAQNVNLGTGTGSNSSPVGDNTTDFVVYNNPNLTSIAPIKINNISYPQMTSPLDLTSTGVNYSSPYGPRNGQNGKFHYGIDIGTYGAKGVAAWSVWKGKIVLHKYHDGAGWYVSVDHGMMNIEGKSQQVYTTYMHLAEDPAIRLKNGAEVKAGDFIGWVSGSGVSDTGSGYRRHLHFEIRLGVDAEHIGGVKYAVNPTPYLQTAFAQLFQKSKVRQ